jgi:hypothetical protein
MKVGVIMKFFLFVMLVISAQLAHADRPSKAISFIPDLCVCKDGASVEPVNCSNFCSDKETHGAEILFANLSVSTEISLSALRNAYGWCNHLLVNDVSNPMCRLEAKSKDGSIKYIDVIAFSNSLTSNVNILNYDEVYTLTLVEVESGARSNSVKFVKFSDVD